MPFLPPNQQRQSTEGRQYSGGAAEWCDVVGAGGCSQSYVVTRTAADSSTTRAAAAAYSHDEHHYIRAPVISDHHYLPSAPVYAQSDQPRHCAASYTAQPHQPTHRSSYQQRGD